MKILITGSAGFIGRHLTSRLQPHHEVFALARQHAPEKHHGAARRVESDLTRPLDRARLPDEIDAVIHLAQSRFYKQFPDRAGDIFEVNVQSTFQLLEYAREAGARCFIFASTGGVYGYGPEKFAETDAVNLSNFYLSSKYSAELLVGSYQQFFRTIIFRFFFVYGPGQEGMLVASLIDKVKHGEAIVIEGETGLRINPIFIDDAVRVFEPALHLQTSAVVNVAGDEIVTIADLVGLIEGVSGSKALVEQRGGREPQSDLVGDNSRMKELLDVHPQITLQEGLRRMS